MPVLVVPPTLLFVLLLFLNINLPLSQSNAETQFHVQNNRIIDNANRECFFHGLNVVYKSPPYLPITDHFDSNLSFADEDMKLLNSLGQNIIRLGVMYPGVMPLSPNDINTTYINEASALISKSYNEYNITTLVDAHQDTISEAMCGEGTPLWATQPYKWNFPEPVDTAYSTDANHIPSKEDCAKYDWFDYLKSEATSTQFQRFYSNYNNLRDSFANYWGILAQSFKNVSGIIGFELLNEPWPGDIYADPSLIESGVADIKNLQPFYQAIAPLIFGNDSDRIVFFESAWYNLLGVTLEMGFETNPFGNDYSNRSGLAFHFYNPPISGDQNEYFRNRSLDGIQLNATSILTEFGIDSVMQSMSETMDNCDDYLISWIGWEYKQLAGALPNGTCTGCGPGIFKENGKINKVNAKAVSRTYPQKVAGHTLGFEFDWKNGGNFTLKYEIDTDIREPTVIYVSGNYWYVNGYELSIHSQNSDVVESKSYGNFIEIYNSNDEQYNGVLVTVEITPK